MSTFTYSPTESVTFQPNGDVSVTDGATTTTFSKTGASKTTVKTPPDPNPPAPETPVSQKLKPNGDVIHTYSDITKTPPVTVRITYRPNGDVEILTTIGQDRKLVDVNGTTGVRRTKRWMDPDPEPQNWGTTDQPKQPKGSGGGGKKGKASKKRPAQKSRPKPKKKSKPAKKKAKKRR